MSARGTTPAHTRPTVDLEVEDGVAWLTLRNPGRRNAITLLMAADLEAHAEAIAADPAIGAAVIRGVDGYFCSGADTADLAAWSTAPSTPTAVRRVSAVYEAFIRFGELPVPTVAVVDGGAVGAGLNLMSAADIVLIAPDARIRSGFAARGLHPGGGHFSLLGRSLGRQQVAALGLFGAVVTGEQAVGLGLALEAHPSASLHQRAAELAATAAADPELARRTKRSLDLELGPAALPWPAAVEVERGVQMWSMARAAERP